MVYDFRDIYLANAIGFCNCTVTQAPEELSPIGIIAEGGDNDGDFIVAEGGSNDGNILIVE